MGTETVKPECIRLSMRGLTVPMAMWYKFVSSVAAGFMIGIGGMVNTISQNRYIGAFLFAVGLFAICALHLDLFTGKVGYAFKKHNMTTLFVIWTGNMFGAALAAANAIVLAIPVKFNFSMSYTQIIFSSMMCGVLVHTAVAVFNDGKLERSFGIFLCVPVFVLCGFRHCIAEAFYAMASGFRTAYIGRILVMTIGNAVGAFITEYAFCIARDIWYLENKKFLH